MDIQFLYVHTIFLYLETINLPAAPMFLNARHESARDEAASRYSCHNYYVASKYSAYFN